MKRYPLIYCFFIVIFLFAILDISNKDKLFSELENRKLKNKVEFSLKKLYEGSFQENYEEYINDQFILRDNWISLKSISESILGKQENNNIIYGKNDYLFEKFTSIDEDRLNVNIASINKFIEAADVNVTTMIAPNSYEIYKEYINSYAPLINQEEQLVSIYEKIKGSNNINLVDSMREEKDKSLYYKTDHHWTTYGAYIAYKEYMKCINEEAIDLEKYEGETVNDFFGTYYSKSKSFSNSGDDITYYNMDGITLDIGENTYDSLYDYSKINTRDKYEMFLYGNNPLTIAQNNQLKNGKKLLVIKDSYANSMIPFLTQNFQEIHIVDLRSFSASINTYLNENSFNDVLIIYNFINFTKENSIAKFKI